MFIECENHYGKRSYNVNNIVFVGEMKDKVSLYFDNGTFLHLSDDYVFIVKRFIEITKIEISSSVYVQFTTKKDERIAFPVKRTRIEVLEDYDTVLSRINSKIGIPLEHLKIDEEIKN